MQTDVSILPSLHSFVEIAADWSSAPAAEPAHQAERHWRALPWATGEISEIIFLHHDNWKQFNNKSPQFFLLIIIAFQQMYN